MNPNPCGRASSDASSSDSAHHLSTIPPSSVSFQFSSPRQNTSNIDPTHPSNPPHQYQIFAPTSSYSDTVSKLRAPPQRKQSSRLSIASELAVNLSTLTMMSPMRPTTTTPATTPMSTLRNKQSKSGFLAPPRTPSPEKQSSQSYKSSTSAVHSNVPSLHTPQNKHSNSPIRCSMTVPSKKTASFTTPTNKTTAQVLQEMNERAQSLLNSSNVIEFTPPNSSTTPDRISASAPRPSPSALASASARKSGRFSGQKIKGHYRRFSNIHNRVFSKMDSIDTHYAAIKSGEQHSASKQIISPNSRTIQMEERLTSSQTDDDDVSMMNTTMNLSMNNTSVDMNMSIDMSMSGGSIFDDARHAPPTSLSNQQPANDTPDLLKTPQNDTVFLKDQGSSKRLANTIPSSASKRRKTTIQGDMLEVQAKKNDPDPKATGSPVRSTHHHVPQTPPINGPIPVSLNERPKQLQQTPPQRPILTPKLRRTGHLPSRDASIESKANHKEKNDKQIRTPLNHKSSVPTFGSRSTPRIARPVTSPFAQTQSVPMQNHTTPQSVPRPVLKKAISVSGNLRTNYSNSSVTSLGRDAPEFNGLKMLASKRSAQNLQRSRIPSSSSSLSLKSETQAFKHRGPSQHRSVTTPIIPSQSSNNNKEHIIRRSASINTLLPSSSSSSSLHTLASSVSAMPSRIPRAVSINGSGILAGNSGSPNGSNTQSPTLSSRVSRSDLRRRDMSRRH